MRFVPAEELVLGTVCSRDIFLTSNKNSAILKRGSILNDNYINYLREKGFIGAYVTDELSADLEIPETVDPRIFQDGVEAVSDESITGLVDVAGSIVKDITDKRQVCADLIDLRSFDDYTFHHSVNVAVYAVLVGRQMGLKQDDLELLCQAGLLHDLGKSRIPNEILNKPDKLTDEEFDLIKSHATFSYEMLKGSYEVSSIVKQAVLSHHENENGSGYPNGREADQLSVLAKIIHVVDVYDALTSKRPYKEPYEPVSAFEYLKGGIGVQFNKDVVTAITDVIPPYPTGVDIFLSNNERALVIDHSFNELRPIVRIASTGKTVDLSKDPEYGNVKIVRSSLIPFGKVEGAVVSALNNDRTAVKLLKKNVLVVDSNKTQRKQTVAAVEEICKTIEFESSLDALSYAKEKKDVDLVMIEVNMPYMDGPTCVERIRRAVGRMVPVIFISADSTRDTIIRCRMMGFSDYILKPAKPVYIKERLNNALYNVLA